jgi:predicted dehydrogenase
MSDKTRYAIVGTGGRHEMYRDAILGVYSARAELTGLCDNNLGRARLSASRAAELTGVIPPVYADMDFDRMIAETRPDTVIVTSRDCTHDHYICRAMELGCDVITEKPMTIDAEKCRRVLDTKRSTGRSLRVTFNYRYSPPRTQIKDLLQSGVVGEVLSVDFHWMLDIHHGADYFRRWHRNRENSGSLLVHKSTHHFDLVNWWLGTVPQSVYATGRRAFYRPETAQRYGLNRRGKRCHGCPEASRCPFFLDMAANPSLKALYLDQEAFDGYHRDQCVFSELIDIEDGLALTVDYRSGAQMSYSLNAFMPWEGYVIVFNGSKGRLEHKTEETVYINGDGSVPGAVKHEGTWIRVYPHFAPAYEIPVWEAVGGHGGGDDLLLRDVFFPDAAPDPWMRRADHRGGAWSILTGIAANLSLREGRSVTAEELVPGLELPDYPPMPDPGDALPLR